MLSVTPLVGIFGGSFDPVHYGHLRSMVELQEALSLDQLRLMPNYQSPLKDQPGANGEQRLAMLQLATEDQPDWLIDQRELARGGPSYTVDSLGELRREFGEDARLCLIMGSDAFATFDRWHQWQRILELAHIVVMARPGEALPEQGEVARLLDQQRVENAEQLVEQVAGKILLQKLTPINISATMIRQHLQTGQSIRDLVPESVWQYINEHHLYGVAV